jgi:hypothetical protein
VVEKSAVPSRELAALGRHVEYHEGVPENFGGNAQGKARLIILDDLLTRYIPKPCVTCLPKGAIIARSPFCSSRRIYSNRGVSVGRHLKTLIIR